jgi:hypothetical protein
MQNKSNYRLRTMWALSGLCFFLLFSACVVPFAKKELELTPVTGKITLEGEPIADAKVVFLPQKLFIEQSLPHPPAAAVTDADGTFRLRTDGADGAPAGDYLVLISKRDDQPSIEQPDLSVIELIRDLDEPRNDLPTEPWMSAETIPFFYNRQTTLRFTIPPKGTNQADFQLSVFDLPLDRGGR